MRPLPEQRGIDHWARIKCSSYYDINETSGVERLRTIQNKIHYLRKIMCLLDCDTFYECIYLIKHLVRDLHTKQLISDASYRYFKRQIIGLTNRYRIDFMGLHITKRRVL